MNFTRNLPFVNRYTFHHTTIVRRIIFLILFSVGCLPHSVFSQQYNFTGYSIEDGLTQSQVFAMYEDSKGFIWIGTDGGGISCFDGISFQNYSTDQGLSTNMIRSIFEDRNQIMWFGTKDGYLNRFDGKTFRQYGKKQGLTSSTVLSITEDEQGNLIVGTEKDGYFQLKDDVFIHQKLPNSDSISISVSDLMFTRSGNLWISTLENGLYKYDGRKYKHYGTTDSLCSNQIYSLDQDLIGNIWMGSDSGVCMFNGKVFKTFTVKDGLCENTIFSIVCDKDGHVWMGSESNGISMYNWEEFSNFNQKNGLCYNYINTLISDRNRNLWIGSNGGGVCKFEGEMFRHITEGDGLAGNIVMTIIEDRNNNIWFGTYGFGISIYDGKKFTNFSKNNGLFSDVIYDILEDKDGFIWICSRDNGIGKYDGSEFTNYNITSGLPSNKVYSSLQDQSGNIWFATLGGGISIYNGAHFTNIGKEDGLGSDFIYTLFEDHDGNIWFGTDDNGIAMIFASCTSNDIIRDKKIEPNSIINISKYGLNSKMVLSICEDTHDNIWIGTFGGGLTRFDGKVLTNYSVKDGLNSNYIYLLHTDHRGYLWAGTEQGLNRIDIRESGTPTTINTYARQEGFKGVETNFNAVMEEKSGNIWFGNLKGATRYNPKTDNPHNQVPQLTLTNIRLFYEDVDWFQYSDSVSVWGQLPLSLTLPPDKNHLTFDFIGIDNIAPAKVRYRWILEGFDKEWSPKQKKNEATYSYIPPGKYTFRVKAYNGNGAVTKDPVSVEVTILAPFWSSMGFYLLLLAIIVIIILIIIRIRLIKLQRERGNLLSKVVEKTNELIMEKMIVDSQTQELQNQKHDLEEINKELEKLSIIAKEMDNGVTILLIDGTIDWRNDAFARIYSDLQNEKTLSVGQNISELGEDHIVLRKFRNCTEKRKFIIYTSKYINSSNEKIWIQTTLTPLFDGNGEINKLVALDTDVTEIKLAEEEINKQNKKLEQEKHKAEEIRQILEEQNKEIKASIRYAKKIQEAILPRNSAIKAVFPESFIIYKPRDIVSGDFYWFADRYKHCLMAAVDCTGHGVPGAFMSMIGNNLLSNIINEKKIYNPARILTELDTTLAYTLNQDLDASFTDGMDIALCSYNQRQQILSFSGANRPLYIIRNGSTDVEEIRGDKFSVGGISAINKSFSLHEIEIQPGDAAYIFSDGYADQFGGESGKKFMGKRLKNALTNICKESMDSQKEVLEKILVEWQGNFSQIDDILLIGLKF